MRCTQKPAHAVTHAHIHVRACVCSLLPQGCKKACGGSTGMHAQHTRVYMHTARVIAPLGFWHQSANGHQSHTHTHAPHRHACIAQYRWGTLGRLTAWIAGHIQANQLQHSQARTHARRLCSHRCLLGPPTHFSRVSWRWFYGWD